MLGALPVFSAFSKETCARAAHNQQPKPQRRATNQPQITSPSALNGDKQSRRVTAAKERRPVLRCLIGDERRRHEAWSSCLATKRDSTEQACASGRCRTSRQAQHRADPRRANWGPFGPIEGDPGPVVAAVWALDESTFKNASVMDWSPEQATMELTARLQMIGLG
jgi:hypothetical protein